MASRWEKHGSGGAGSTSGIAQRIDPYLQWAALTAGADLGGPSTWYALLIRVQGITAREFARGEWYDANGARPDRSDWLRVPSWYAVPSRGLEAIAWCTARVTPRFFAELADPGSALARLVGEYAFGWSPDSPIGVVGATEQVTWGATPLYPPLPGAAPGPVTVGVIDDGIAFAHRRFRDRSGGTRLEGFWDQREAPSRHGAPQQPVGPVPYGHGLDATAIDALLRRATPVNGAPDEDRVYRDAGNREVARRGRHGTHVMDLACGALPGDRRRDPRIVAVQLPRSVALDTGGHLLAPHVLDAMRFIVDRSDRAAAREGFSDPLPIAINLSYGRQAGPHDGSSPLERAMDELVEHRRAARAPLAIVVGAGNSHLARCHATVALDAKGKGGLAWRVPPDQARPTFVEIWLPRATASATPRVRLTLSPPGSTPATCVDVDAGETWVMRDPTQRPGAAEADEVIATVQYRAAGAEAPALASPGAGRGVILVTVAPTRRQGGTRSVAPAGTWKAEFENLAERACTVEAWIERADSPYGFARAGVQPRFEDAAYEVFDRAGRPVETDGPTSCTVRRAGTLSGLATGRETIVVGASRRDRGTASRYSSSGPAIAPAGGGPARSGPDVAAPGDDGAAHRGTIAAGTRSAAVHAMDGTSVAAPRVTRLVAAAMSGGRAVGRADVAQAIGAVAGGSNGAGLLPAQPDPRTGSGIAPPADDGRPRRMG